MKSGEAPAEKAENFGEKLRRVGKKGGQTTPVASFSKRQQLKHELLRNCGEKEETPSRISARKLAATLWELDQMHHGGGAPLPRLRRLNHGQLYKDKTALEPPLDPSPGSLYLPESSNTLRRDVATTLMQHYQSAERNNHALQPVSPASYGSSMEIAPYNPAATPTSSVGRNGETNYSLRTSTELLKVLNRIWSLEEQHVSNTSLVKSLKKELGQARAHIKVLLRDQQTDRREMDELMKQITDEKAVRDEVEDERKLRKRSESLHRKLARELYDVKTALVKTAKDLENERTGRALLEDLCDEFALGIRGYEKEVRGLRQKFDKDWTERGDHRDQMILHLSETWLDERMHRNGVGVVQKLSSEIEAFLRAKRRINGPKNRRSSLESIPLNAAASAPQEDEDDDDSDGPELAKTAESLKKVNKNFGPSEIGTGLPDDDDGSDGPELAKKAEPLKRVKKKIGPSETGPSGLRVKFEEETAHENKNRGKDTDGFASGPGPGESDVPAKESNSDMNSNSMMENLIRNHRYLLSESGPTNQEFGLPSSIWRSQPSPVRHWTEKLPAHEIEPSSKMHQDSTKETSSLKAKLFEARSRGQRSRSRLKAASIIPSSRKE